MPKLGVNIDHVATIRNARGGDHPDPLRAAECWERMMIGCLRTNTAFTVPFRDDTWEWELEKFYHHWFESDKDMLGLIGKELFPLSAIVQTMRKTQQTSLYLDRLGPFFVGKALWQSALA